MKSSFEKLSDIAPVILFPVVYLLRKRRNIYLLLIGIVCICNSCFKNYYTTNTVDKANAADLAAYSSNNKYFIIHFKNAVKGLESVSIAGDSIYGKLVELPANHAKYLNPYPGSDKNEIKAKDKSEALTEVHLYTTATYTNKTDFVSNISAFNRVDMYELNEEATSVNATLSVIGIVGASVVVVGAVILAIGCGCPHVFMDNNGQYVFQSGLYTGAVYSTLERMDYLPLQAVAFDTPVISMKITNANNEEQFMNTLQLWQVMHPADMQVLMDKYGKAYSYKETNAPVSAFTAKDNNVVHLLTKTDEQYYAFDNASNENGFSSVLLQFQKPASAREANLVLHARNSYWSSLISKEMMQMFGEQYAKWRDLQETKDPKDQEKWQMEQALPMMVYVKTGKGWKLADYFPMIGNMAIRDLLMHINLDEIAGDTLEIKLETAYRYWDLDYAGIDYTSETTMPATRVDPEKIVKSDNTNLKEVLQQNDNAYAHLVNDEFISVQYTVQPPAPGQQASYFLVSGGYYHSLEEFEGKANYQALLKFRQKGYFDKFSREKYVEAQQLAARVKQLEK